MSISFSLSFDVSLEPSVLGYKRFKRQTLSAWQNEKKKNIEGTKIIYLIRVSGSLVIKSPVGWASLILYCNTTRIISLNDNSCLLAL